MKKYILLITTVILTLNLAAKVFLPDYSLSGYVPVKQNQLDVYKTSNKYKLYQDKTNFLPGFEVYTLREIDYDKGVVKLTAKYGNKYQLYPEVYIDLDDYLEMDFKTTYHDLLYNKSLELLEEEDRTSGEGIIKDIVIKMPKIAKQSRTVRRIFGGDKAGSLSLDGNQKITFAGSSTTRENAEQTEDNQRSDFNLEMRQEMNLRLRGTIGEKIHVDVNHSSGGEDDFLSEPSEIKIRYEGFEDEVVKSVELGNISLALQGSNFISYSISSEGLFGVKSDMEFGDLKLTSIIGKDEAQKSTQKYTGTSQADSTVIESRNFVNYSHYFIADPYNLFAFYNSEDPNADQYPDGWIGNAIKVDEQGAWLVPAGVPGMGQNLLPKDGTDVNVYLDNDNANDNITAIEGTAVNEDGTFYFDQLIEGRDYTVNYDTGLITFSVTINQRYSIGITYTRNDGTMVPTPSGDGLKVKLIKEKNQDVNSPYWNQQVRNIYDLGMQNIKNEGFDLNVFNYNENDNTRNYDVPSDVPLNDAEIVTYNDYLRLDSNGDGVVNGDDATVNLQSGYIIFPFLKPFAPLGDAIIYEEEVVNYDEFKMNIAVKGQVGRDQISLGQMNILPGSVVVKLTEPVNKTLKENVDYIVDYDFGTVTLLSPEAKDPNAKIEIDYQFKPLFAVESKTIMGVRADWEFNPNLKLGGTFIYHSEKVSDDRPKIGNENFSIILADLDGRAEYETPFLTKLIDWFPLIKTDAESKVTLNGEVAMSIPNIYGNPDQDNINEAYIDDMESILDNYPLGITRRAWVRGSKPFNYNLPRADINWYNPTNIYARDVYDPNSLSEDEEDEKISVLTCKLDPPDVGNPGLDNKYWGGLMKYLGNQLDFSDKKYIEVLVKVDSIAGSQPPVTMHVDLGDINEDFYTEFGGEGKLNTEDGVTGRPKDGILDYDEDVGLDGIPNGEAGDDPNDNFDNNKDGNGDYPHINGSENNSLLDTEDLDGNGSLNMADIYFEYSLSLKDSLYLQSEYKGWRLYRIPLQDEDNYSIVSNDVGIEPNYKKISYARIWFEVEELSRVRIVNLDLVGNKWEEGFIKDEDDNIISVEELQNNSEKMLVGIVDNQRSPHYQPAPGSVIKKNGEKTLEQSLYIDYENLQPGHHGLAHQKFRESTNLLSYNKIKFWIYPEAAQNQIIEDDSLTHDLIIRIGADSLNYYEVRKSFTAREYLAEMNKSGWMNLEIDFSDLTKIKSPSQQDSLITENNFVYYYKDGIRYGMKREPTLSVIKELAVGIQQNTEATESFSGRIYFDDIRVADPYEEIGFASQASLHTTLADFSTLDVDLNWKTQNFQNNASRRRNVSNSSETISLNITNKYFLDKFFPADWGLSMPLTLSRNQSLGTPRFKANSDILREDLNKKEKEQEKDKSLIYNANVTFRQNKTPRSKILAYTLKNTSVSGNVQKKQITSPTTADTTTTYRLSHNYDLSLPKDALDLKLWGDYKFYFAPNKLENSLTYNNTIPKRWMWDTTSDTLSYWKPRPQTVETKTLETETFIKYDIFSDIAASYELNTTRDLMRENTKISYIGQEKERTQVIGLDYNPGYFDKIFTLSSTADVTYREQHKKISQSSEEEEEQYIYEGSVNRSLGGSFTLKNKQIFSSWASKLAKTENKQNTIPPEDRSATSQQTQPDTSGLPSQERGQAAQQQQENYLPTSTGTGAENTDEQTPAEQTESGKTSQTPADTTKAQPPETEEKTGNRIFYHVISYLARIDNFRFNYDNNYKTDYENREERPDFVYQLGLPHILPDEEIKVKTNNDRFNVSTGLLVLNNLSTTWNFSHEINRTFGNTDKKTIKTIFPDVSVTLSEFEKIIKAEKILTSSRLTSSYTVSKTQSGDFDWEQPQTEQTQLNMRPLISWNGNWANNITSNLALNYSETENLTHYETYDIVQNETRQSLTSNLEYTFSAESGIKLPLLGKLRFKNEFTADLDFSLEKTYKTTKGNNKTNIDTDKISYSLTPGGTYRFSKNIHGGLDIRYDWSHDQKKDLLIKTFELSLWVEILF